MVREHASAVGRTEAFVGFVEAVNRGACQIPRPYVAATSTGADAPAGEVLSSTTGAAGNPVPNTDQQLERATAQLATWLVK
jgi:hypothetical protein